MKAESIICGLLDFLIRYHSVHALAIEDDLAAGRLRQLATTEVQHGDGVSRAVAG
jgi:hypothetical protein